MITPHFTSILINKIKGFNIIDENEEYCVVEVGAGENWHHFVMWSVYHNLGGLENMAYIPGTVGAAPIQNIGAYGIEQKDSFVSCQALNRKGLFMTVFEKAVCEFGYRDSIFKNEIKDQFIISHVTYRLRKNPVVNSSYKDVNEKLREKNIEFPTVRNIAETVIEIRKAKLPDPEIIGNAGSFFKNPIIDIHQFSKLINDYPEVPNFPVDDEKVKIPAAWLIDKAGLKGIRRGDTGTHINQPLVIVNYGNANGEDLFNLANYIQKTVLDMFGIVIEPEVNIW
jgi:UDP-N-acetylmuramate dehydrogenase